MNSLTLPNHYSSIIDMMMDDIFPTNTKSTFRFTSTDSFPKLNLKKRTENGNTSFIIEAALAGYRKEDITLKIDRNVLEISCEKQEKDADEYFLQEISARSFSRKIVLGDSFDTGNPTVTFKDGILQIVFGEDPKKAPKTLQIA